jgi:hypothetical protein
VGVTGATDAFEVLAERPLVSLLVLGDGPFCVARAVDASTAGCVAEPLDVDTE